MHRPPPRSTRTDTLFPSPTLCRSAEGLASLSDPAVTRDKILLKANQRGTARRGRSDADADGDYRDSVYRELQGLIEAPEAPMLRPAQAVRTLILPYAD